MVVRVEAGVGVGVFGEIMWGLQVWLLKRVMGLR